MATLYATTSTRTFIVVIVNVDWLLNEPKIVYLCYSSLWNDADKRFDLDGIV